MPRAAALALVLLLIPATVGCGGEETAPEEVRLSITGAVAAEQALTWTDLSNLGWESLDLPRSEGPRRPYTGLRLSALLALAGVEGTPTTITFTADDGSEYSLPLADVLACADCAIVTLMGRRLQAAMPGFADEAWVYDLTGISVG